MKRIMFNDKYGLTDAVLKGRKTMKRRLINPDYEMVSCLNVNYEDHWHGELNGEIFDIIPIYEIGEIAAVAQRYRDIADDKFFINEIAADEHCGVNAMKYDAGWDNKMFVKAAYMPHHIRITEIKVQRLQDISDEDCLKEGITKWERGLDLYYYCKEKFSDFNTPREAFAALIDKVSGNGTWERNPWVFAYSFKLID